MSQTSLSRSLQTNGRVLGLLDSVDLEQNSREPREEARVVGLRIREARQRRGLTLSTVAESIGVTYQQLQKYETGVNRISASRLARLAAVLDMPFEYFVGGSSAAKDGEKPTPIPSSAARRTFVRARVIDAMSRVLARESSARGQTLLDVLAQARATASERSLVLSGLGVPTIDLVFRIAWALSIEPGAFVLLVEEELFDKEQCGDAA